MDEKYKVYIKTDAEGRVIAINSSAFLESIDGCILIDEGVGDKYHHAQGNYLEKPILNVDGTHNYLFQGNGIREATSTEKATEKASFQAVLPSEDERLAAAESALLALMEGANNV